MFFCDENENLEDYNNRKVEFLKAFVMSTCETFECSQAINDVKAQYLNKNELQDVDILRIYVSLGLIRKLGLMLAIKFNQKKILIFGDFIFRATILKVQAKTYIKECVLISSWAPVKGIDYKQWRIDENRFHRERIPGNNFFSNWRKIKNLKTFLFFFCFFVKRFGW